MNRVKRVDAKHRITALVIILVASAGGGCAYFLPAEPPPAYFWIVHSRDRSDSDRVVDQHRQPEKLLEFWDVRPGMRVAELGAGDGYFTELLARVVGAKGTVYAQIARNEPERNVARLAARLKSPVMQGVVQVTRDFDEPLPPEARGLDLVTSNFLYHSLLGVGTDRAKMNRAIFEALKPGGLYAVTDYSGRPGSGEGQAGMQRADVLVVRKEVEAAGFRFADQAMFLQGAADARDAPVSRLGGADAFALKFVKP